MTKTTEAKSFNCNALYAVDLIKKTTLTDKKLACKFSIFKDPLFSVDSNQQNNFRIFDKI